jgi:hypothetical protein
MGSRVAEQGLGRITGMPSTGRNGNRNRVLADRLWDEVGREWTTKRTDWLSSRQVQQLIKRDQHVVICGFGRSMKWLDAKEAQLWWSQARRHLVVPGEQGGSPDTTGLTWGAHLWRSGDDRLLGFETFC